MIRGIQKNVIWVQTPKSQYFEEVHFIVRREAERDDSRNGEMAKEANRILAEANPQSKRPLKARTSRSSIAFLWGMLSGSLLVAVAWILSALAA